MSRPPHVVIVGAGLAGTSAAAVFVEAGWRITLIDKAGKPGGRCATRRVARDADSAWFDYGAQYFTAADTHFRALVETDLGTGHLQRWSPRIGVAERGPNGWQITASPDSRERFVAPTGLNHWVRHRLACTGIDADCGQRASAITRHDQVWQVHCDNGVRHTDADALLITVPPVQARELLGERAAQFDALVGAATALRACHSWVVRTPALDFEGLFCKGGNLAWCADNSHKAGATSTPHRLWTLHASPEFSEQHVEATPDAIRALLVDEFAAVTGQSPSDLDAVHGHRWRYARPGDGAPPGDTGYALDAQDRLALAGDWLCGGRVEGAWSSGRQAALALLGA